LSLFANEIDAILSAFQVHITVLYCDTRIGKVEEWDSQDCPIKFSPVGRGGTAVKPVFDWIERQSGPPSCLIYMTDMEVSDFPESEPGYPVLWIQTGDDNYYSQRCKVGEIIKID
jgi:predicted metal-dependent peptidase